MDDRYPEGPLGGSVTRLHGFLTSVNSGPVVMPSEWMPIVFGDSQAREWGNMNEVQRAMDLLMRFNNEVAGDLLGPPDRFSIMIDRIGEPPDTEDFADDWCKGYSIGIALREDEWQEPMQDQEMLEFFLPILAIVSPKELGLDSVIKDRAQYRQIIQTLPSCAFAIYGWWRKQLGASIGAGATVRRTDPKISPNAPCPCGSGKKYKRCCSPLRAF